MDPFIDHASTLASLIPALAEAPWIGIDTEFLRERTFRPRLCLLQTATPAGVACLDPLTLDLTPAFQAIEGPSLKIGHALRQDFEIWHQIRGRLPKPFFDTQIAAALLGYDDQTGYATLVESELGIALDKRHTRTDWSARPLSPEQLHYAGNDVRHLGALYERLGDRLAQKGRGSWLMEECERLLGDAHYGDDLTAVMAKFGQAHRLPLATQQVLLALIQWREAQARLRDRPRQWIIADDLLMRIAARAPRTLADLRAIKGFTPPLWRFAQPLLEVLTGAPMHDGPPPWPQVHVLTEDEQLRFRKLAAQVKQRAAEIGVPASLLAARRDLERAARGQVSTTLAGGWRRQVLSDLIALPPGA